MSRVRQGCSWSCPQNVATTTDATDQRSVPNDGSLWGSQYFAGVFVSSGVTQWQIAWGVFTATLHFPIGFKETSIYIISLHGVDELLQKNYHVLCQSSILEVCIPCKMEIGVEDSSLSTGQDDSRYLVSSGYKKSDAGLLFEFLVRNFNMHVLSSLQSTRLCCVNRISCMSFFTYSVQPDYVFNKDFRFTLQHIVVLTDPSLCIRSMLPSLKEDNGKHMIFQHDWRPGILIPVFTLILLHVNMNMAVASSIRGDNVRIVFNNLVYGLREHSPYSMISVWSFDPGITHILLCAFEGKFLGVSGKLNVASVTKSLLPAAVTSSIAVTTVPISDAFSLHTLLSPTAVSTGVNSRQSSSAANITYDSKGSNVYGQRTSWLLQGLGGKNVGVFSLIGGYVVVPLLTHNKGICELQATNVDSHLGGVDEDHNMVNCYVEELAQFCLVLFPNLSATRKNKLFVFSITTESFYWEPGPFMEIDMFADIIVMGGYTSRAECIFSIPVILPTAHRLCTWVSKFLAGAVIDGTKSTNENYRILDEPSLLVVYYQSLLIVYDVELILIVACYFPALVQSAYPCISTLVSYTVPFAMKKEATACWEVQSVLEGDPTFPCSYTFFKVGKLYNQHEVLGARGADAVPLYVIDVIMTYARNTRVFPSSNKFLSHEEDKGGTIHHSELNIAPYNQRARKDLSAIITKSKEDVIDISAANDRLGSARTSYQPTLEQSSTHFKSVAMILCCHVDCVPIFQILRCVLYKLHGPTHTVRSSICFDRGGHRPSFGFAILALLTFTMRYAYFTSLDVQGMDSDYTGTIDGEFITANLHKGERHAHLIIAFQHFDFIVVKHYMTVVLLEEVYRDMFRLSVVLNKKCFVDTQKLICHDILLLVSGYSALPCMASQHYGVKVGLHLLLTVLVVVCITVHNLSVKILRTAFYYLPQCIVHYHDGGMDLVVFDPGIGCTNLGRFKVSLGVIVVSISQNIQGINKRIILVLAKQEQRFDLLNNIVDGDSVYERDHNFVPCTSTLGLAQDEYTLVLDCHTYAIADFQLVCLCALLLVSGGTLVDLLWHIAWAEYMQTSLSSPLRTRSFSRSGDCHDTCRMVVWALVA